MECVAGEGLRPKKSGVYAAVDRLDPTVVTVEDLYFLGARKAN